MSGVLLFVAVIIVLLIIYVGPVLFAAAIIFGSLWAVGRWLDQTNVEREQRRRRRLEEEKERPQREWQRQYQVYVESEMLKGATREEAEATARGFLGPSPDEIAEEKRRAKERLKEERAREAAEQRARKEEERRKKAEAEHNQMVLEDRAELDAQRLKREAKRRAAEERGAAELAEEARAKLAEQANAPVEPEYDEEAVAISALLLQVPDRFHDLVVLLLSKDGRRVEYATDDTWIRFIVGTKPYAVLHFDRDGALSTGGNLLTVRVNPDLSDYLQSQHTGIVSGDHTDDGGSWVVVNLDGDLPEKLLSTLCNMSYDLACR